jgi:hypothetical protein
MKYKNIYLKFDCRDQGIECCVAQVVIDNFKLVILLLYRFSACYCEYFWIKLD